MNSQVPLLFAPTADRSIGEKIGAHLGVVLSPLEEREFEDGEHKIRPLVSVRDRDVFVVQSLYSDQKQSVNDKLCRFLFLLGALRDASASRVTAVIPYLCYARKDRRSKARDPLTSRYIAQLIEALGADRVVTMDVHNLAAYQNAFRIRTEHLEAKKIFVEHFSRTLPDSPVVVVSPDTGGVKRAEEFRERLSRSTGRPVSSAFIEKYRSEGVLTGGALVGDVTGMTAIIIDDLISSGSTLARAASSCRTHGATSVHAAATHALFSSKADETLATPSLDSIVITNSVTPFRLTAETVGKKLVVLDITRLVAEAIRRIHSGGSIVELLEA